MTVVPGSHRLAGLSAAGGRVMDRALNDRKFIVPGLGDFGDRLFGT